MPVVAHSSTRRKLIPGLLLAFVLVAVASLTGTGARAHATQEFSPLAARVVAPPRPVRTTDGHRHLLYEVQLTNTSKEATVRIDRIVARDAHAKRVLRSWSGGAVAGVVQQPGVPSTRTLGLHESATAFLNVPLGRGDGTPKRLIHRFDVTMTPPPAGVVFDGHLRGVLRTRVIDKPAVRIGRPLIGAGYLDQNGCCDKSFHTRALQTIGTTSYNAQRFAIDWVKLDKHGRSYHGDFAVNRNHLIFGEPVVAVAGAKVVETLDRLPENTPGQPPDYDVTPSTNLGNHVIIGLGDGRYALYAHLKTGSVRVHVGERVRRGQVLGKVGNSGNSTSPHLHFHVMDAPDALASNGLPYVFNHFRLTGRATNVDDVEDGKPAHVVPAPPPVRRERVLPLQADVMGFGS